MKKGREGKGREGKGRAGQGRAGQGRAGQGRAGQGRAGQGRAGQGRAGRKEGRKEEGRKKHAPTETGPFHNRTHKTFLLFACVETPHSDLSCIERVFFFAKQGEATAQALGPWGQVSALLQ